MALIRTWIPALAGLLPLVSTGPAARAEGDGPTAEQGRFFERDVRPILAEHCFKCHGPEKQKGGLRLDSRASILAGGDSGPAIEPDEPGASLILEAINYEGLQMPPSGQLDAGKIAALTQWIEQGGPWPDSGGAAVASAPEGSKITDEDRAWWSFQPVREPEVPAVGDGWSRGPIDRFIFRQLETAGLTPAPEADRATLIRRVWFDVTGLPPTPEEMDAALADTSADAHERLVERLLDSPRYGERQARHWLDLVRYADSDGYRIDHGRPNAWRYRDYVIGSFNGDKPYDRFVQEQIAGDELFPGDPEALTATGYLRHWIYEYNNRDVRGQWSVILDDITDTTSDVFLGLGVQCARCHDHKFDPILQADYYRLQAFFAPILPRDDLVAATPHEVADYRARLAGWEARTADLRGQIEAIEARSRAGAARDAIGRFPPDIQEMIRKPVAGRTPLEHQLAELAYRQVDYEYSRLDGRLKGTDKEEVIALRKRLAAFQREKPVPLPVAMAVTDVGPEAPPVSIPRRGETPIEPGFPTIFGEEPATIEPLPAAPRSTGRRAALARWLTRPDNPLTARVIVNRVWQQHFGRGLAANPSDFGRLGEAPTHPELLDWLTSQFVRDGWSLKRLHALILTSATYRQSPRHPRAEPCRLKDPENRLYWRGETHRLDAEEIRDAILAMTGELDLTAGGPGVDAGQPRRTIYTRRLRNTRDPLLDVFDLPLFFSSTPSRDTTTTPLQSLILINSQMMLLRARSFADRLERDGSADEGRLVDRAYRLAFGRGPDAEEAAAALAFLHEQAGRIDPETAAGADAAFLHDKIPQRDGQAAVLSPEGPQARFEVPHREQMADGAFTVEAFFLLRSVYDSGSVRTVASKWDGDMREPGWAFGVTGKGSRRKPQTLALQLIGKKLDGSFGEEAVFSDQNIQLDRPYYVAAAVTLAGDGPGTVTFSVKDLSNDDEPLLVARVPHAIAGGFGNRFPLSIGGRAGKGACVFDGLIDDVRLSDGALGVERLLYTAEGVSRDTLGFWRFEPEPGVFRDSAGHGLDIRPASRAAAVLEPRRQALVDFCHALLNSSEFLYVD